MAFDPYSATFHSLDRDSTAVCGESGNQSKEQSCREHILHLIVPTRGREKYMKRLTSAISIRLEHDFSRARIGKCAPDQNQLCGVGYPVFAFPFRFNFFRLGLFLVRFALVRLRLLLVCFNYFRLRLLLCHFTLFRWKLLLVSGPERSSGKCRTRGQKANNKKYLLHSTPRKVWYLCIAGQHSCVSVT